MSKALACIEMLKYLSTGGIYKVSELASLLETSSRNIIEYKRVLDCAGYYIESIPGRYGGYRLERSALFPMLKMTDKEKEALCESINYIVSKKDFINKSDFQSAMGKVLANTSYVTNDKDLLVVDKYQLTMEEKDIRERYLFLEKAINKRIVIDIEYNSLKSGLKNHCLHPYKLFIYNNSWFFLAYNPEVGEVWYFKVNRIKSFKYSDKKFYFDKTFDEKKYFDEFGMKKNGDYYHVELIVSNKRAMLMKERVYGKNQVVEELDDGTIKVSLDMQQKEMILSYVLQCGKDVKVLSPEWLKEDLINTINEIKSFYDV